MNRLEILKLFLYPQWKSELPEGVDVQKLLKERMIYCLNPQALEDPSNYDMNLLITDEGRKEVEKLEKEEEIKKQIEEKRVQKAVLVQNAESKIVELRNVTQSAVDAFVKELEDFKNSPITVDKIVEVPVEKPVQVPVEKIVYVHVFSKKWGGKGWRWVNPKTGKTVSNDEVGVDPTPTNEIGLPPKVLEAKKNTCLVLFDELEEGAHWNRKGLNQEGIPDEVIDELIQEGKIIDSHGELSQAK